MDLNQGNLDSLFFALNASLNKGLAKAWTGYERFAMPVMSSTSIEKYPMTIITGAMREWIGPRVINTLSGKMLEVRNRDFEHTEKVSRNDIEDDSIGFHAPLFEAMGISAANLWPQLATEALCNAGNWADGAAFFSASRKVGKSTINNIVDSALTATTYSTAKAQMMNFAGPDKQPLGLVPTVLMVGATLEDTARRILKAETVNESGVAVSNIYKDSAELLINPFMTGDYANMWFLFCDNRGIKPVAVQKRKEGSLQRWDKDSDSCVKDRNENEYGLHYRGEAVAVAPHLVIGGNLG